MRSFRSKPVGWRGESYRHYLAAKGVKTRYFSTDKEAWLRQQLGNTVKSTDRERAERKKREEERRREELRLSEMIQDFKRISREPGESKGEFLKRLRDESVMLQMKDMTDEERERLVNITYTIKNRKYVAKKELDEEKVQEILHIYKRDQHLIDLSKFLSDDEVADDEGFPESIVEIMNKYPAEANEASMRILEEAFGDSTAGKQYVGEMKSMVEGKKPSLSKVERQAALDRWEKGE